VDQTAGVHGSGNIVVQAAEGSSVTIGVLPHLELTPRHRLRHPPKTDIDLLNPFADAIPFIGREAELSRLDAWLASPAPISARCLTGRAGSGKTRLALELCARANARPPAWDAGFAEHRELERFANQQNLSAWGWQRPTLIVVDYAAGVARWLRPWLEELAQNPGCDGIPLRLLMLERFADEGVGWWSGLMQSGWSNRGVPELFDPPAPEPVEPIAAKDRTRLVAAILQAAGAATDAAETSRLEAGAEGAGATEALDLLMAGLTAATGMRELGGARPTGRIEMARALANHEWRRLDAIARDRSLEADVFAHTAAVLTMQGGAELDAALEMIESEAEALRSRADPRALFNALRDAYAATNGERLPPILPDLIGEAFILRTFLAHSAKQQALAIARARTRAEAATVASVIHVVQDFAEDEAHPALRWLDALIVKSADLPALMRLADAFPQRTLALRERAAHILSNVAHHLRVLAAEPENLSIQSEIEGERAHVLNNLSLRLSDLGRREEALKAIEDAVAVYRALSQALPDVFRPYLAMSLNNLSNYLSDLGRLEEGLKAVAEAVAIRRALLQAHPDAFRPDLAMSLTNLSIRLGGLGRREEAMVAVAEAVSIRRVLSQARPGAFRPDLASSLNSLSIRLSDLGRREEALEAVAEAVAIRRALAAALPDAFRPDLASSLNILSNHLSDLDRREEALEAIVEAVAIHRALAAALPDAFRPDLASSLNNLSNRLGDLDRREEALEAIEEAVAIRRALAALRPDAFRPDLAMSLNNLSVCLGKLGRREEALQAITEAVAVYRALSQAAFGSIRSGLAASLNNLSARLSGLGRREEALEAIAEAVAVYRALSQAHPDAFRPDLASSLSVAADCLEALDDLPAALKHNSESLVLLLPYFKRRPHLYLAVMVAVSGNYLRRSEKASVEPDWTLLAEVMKVFQRLPGNRPQAAEE